MKNPFEWGNVRITQEYHSDHLALDLVSDLDYYKEGMDEAKVKGLVAGNNALWVFREPSDANTTSA